MVYPKLHTRMRRLLSFALTALFIGSMLGGALWNISSILFTTHALTKFSSEEELVDFLKTNPRNAPQSLFEKLWSAYQQPFPDSGTRLLLSSFGSNQVPGTTLEGAGSSDFSTTNIQVAGVDEADTVKTDGEYIYLASGSTVYILRAYPSEDAKVLSKISLNATVIGIFVNSGKLILFYSKYGTGAYGAYNAYYELAKTTIIVYDISNRSRPTLERDVTVDGRYFSSRMIGDYVYVVINKPAYVVNNSKVILPEIRSGNSTTKVSASSIYYTGLLDYSYYFAIVVAINVQDAKMKPTIEPLLLGSTSQIYVSRESIYLTSIVYATPLGTRIHKINIKDGDIAYVASGNVSGYVLNQYSMDEYKGLFRVATSDGKSSNVYVLDEKLKATGKLEGLAPGESLHSARFMGDRCYLVTFKKVDPLFVIDLEDPRNPQVLGKLKIPGYSDYLHPYDETHLIGVGKETVEAESGDFAWYQGVKISLFDVSDVAQPKELDKVIIGDRGTDTPVLRDPKAFLFSKSKHLLVLPILLAKIDKAKYPQGVPPSTSGDFVWQGAYVFNLTLDRGFALMGRFTHMEDAADLMKSGFYFSSPYSVKRSLYIDDVLYTISERKVKMNSLENLNETAALNLP